MNKRLKLLRLKAKMTAQRKKYINTLITETQGKAFISLEEGFDSTMVNAHMRQQLGSQYTETQKDVIIGIASRYLIAPADVVKYAVDSSKPPSNAVYLLYLFLPKKNRVALLGDLEEEYKEVYARFGAKSANIWFWKQVLTSLWPLFSVWCKKPLTSVSKWLEGTLVEYFYRKSA